MAKGDIVLVPFPFTDLTGRKLRPAVVLIETDMDLTVTFITSQMKWAEPSDVALSPSVESGIKVPSLIRLSKIATIDRQLAAGLLGALTESERKQLDKNLKTLLQLT